MQQSQLDNIEKLHGFLTNAIYIIEKIENEWEEDVLTEDQEDRILDLKDTMNDILDDMEDRFEEIEKSIMDDDKEDLEDEKV